MNQGERDEDRIEGAASSAAAHAQKTDDKATEGSATEEPKSAKTTVPAPKVTVGQWVFLAAVAAVTAGLDLWTKALAIKKLSMSLPGRSVALCQAPPGGTHYLYQRVPQGEYTVIRDYLHFRYAENCGGAWGLLHGAREGLRKPFFLLVTVGAVAFIVHLYRTLEPGQKLMRWALPLVLGGAIGNLVDRVRLGYVVDFIDAHWKERYHWPTFNVADIAITVGIALMLLEYIVGPRKTAKPTPRPTAS